MIEIIMALGDLLFEEIGKQICSWTVDSIEPTAEISRMGNTKYKDENIITHWTISVKLGQNGVSYAQGRGIMYAENNEVATYSINGIGKAKIKPQILLKLSCIRQLSKACILEKRPVLYFH
jgi:hypothetical protein